VYPAFVDPTDDTRIDYYVCNEGYNLQIVQNRKGVENKGRYIEFRGIKAEDYVYIPSNFTFGEVKTISRKQDYRFLEYSQIDTNRKIYVLSWQTEKLNAEIRAVNTCLSQNNAVDELVKIAESLEG